jgi:hypothetical protein
LTACKAQRILVGPSVASRCDEARKRDIERPVPTKRDRATSKHFLQLAIPKSHLERALLPETVVAVSARCDALESASKKIDAANEKRVDGDGNAQ